VSDSIGVAGEFRLLHKIGEGGMADVFLAERLGDDGFRTRVALKRLHRGLAMDSYFIRQLIREARLLGQLEHANIVRVFDLRRVGDEYYVVMEYVDGIDLAAVVKVHRSRKTRIPRPFFFHVGLSLAEALSYAHSAVDENGKATPLIHRDIKPSNVMLSRRGIVKLTDFGIAHVGDDSVTGGLVQGTANYMSPEQAFGSERLTPASDVYSLGAVFYEMLTGRPLINGDNYLKAIHQVRERKVTLDELASLGVEPGLRMVIAKMLSADLAGRYHEMESVRNDLQFVADRLKIDLSWHRIRAYVGRLMGLLGRPPGRATLSGLSVSESFSPSNLLRSESVDGGRQDEPGRPVTPPTPPPVPRVPVEESEVTRAVAKDILEAGLREMAEASSPALPEPPGGASGESTVAFPQTGSRPAASLDVGLPPVAPLPPPGPAFEDDGERTRVFGGPTPSEAGVYGTARVSAIPTPEPAPPVPVRPAGWATDSQQLQPLDTLARVAKSSHLGPTNRGLRALAPTPDVASNEEEQTLPPGTPLPESSAPPSAPPVPPAAYASDIPTPSYGVAAVSPPPASPAVSVGVPPGAMTSGHMEVLRRRRRERGPDRRDKRRKGRNRRRPLAPGVIGLLVASVLFLLSVLFLYVYAVRFQASAAPADRSPPLETEDLPASDPGILSRSPTVPTRTGFA
jgi:serine/threonine-protein kinase